MIVKTLLIVMSLIVAAAITYYLFFPSNVGVVFPRSDGSTVTFSRTNISFESAPDYFPSNGFVHIKTYVSRLLAPSRHIKFVSIFTPDGIRGFGLTSNQSVVTADLTVEWRQETNRETAIRSFFISLGSTPLQDYLAANGGVSDATRILAYPLKGNTAEVTSIVQRILQELCGISTTEPLNISYSEK